MAKARDKRVVWISNEDVSIPGTRITVQICSLNPIPGLPSQEYAVADFDVMKKYCDFCESHGGSCMILVDGKIHNGEVFWLEKLTTRVLSYFERSES